LADELRDAFGVESKLIAGGNGIFDVIVDGKLIYSKDDVGRFPNPGEIVGKIKEFQV